MSYFLVWRKYKECVAKRGEIIGTQEMILIDPTTLHPKNKTSQKCFREKTKCKSFLVF